MTTQSQNLECPNKCGKVFHNLNTLDRHERITCPMRWSEIKHDPILVAKICKIRGWEN